MVVTYPHPTADEASRCRQTAPGRTSFRMRSTASCTVSRAVSSTRCGAAHGSYSRFRISVHVGSTSSGNIDGTAFSASPVKPSIRTAELHFQRSTIRCRSNRTPPVSGQLQRIDAICDDRMPLRQLLTGQRTAHLIAFAQKRLPGTESGTHQRLFQSINAQVPESGGSCQSAGHRGFSGTRQPAEQKQNRFAHDLTSL